MWLIYSILIGLIVGAAISVVYKKEPPWFITGAWVLSVISTILALNQQGDVQAVNTAVGWVIFLIFLHVTHWLYTKAKGGAKKLADAIPKKTHIDDSIYDQVAAELSSNQIHAGLMARAIAEADGDKDRTQAIYIKLRAAAIAKEREQARHDAADKEAEAWKAQAEKDAKAFVDAQKEINDSRTEFVKGMVRAETNNNEDLSSDYSLRSPARRSWENKLAHRVGLCFLWYTIVGLIGAILFTLFSVPDWSRFTTQEIGEFIAISAMFLGLALLCYVGTLKLKW